MRPDAVGIILTAFTDVDVLIESINLGHVYRYITKPWDAKEVKGVLTQAIERFHLRRDNARLHRQLEQYAGYLTQRDARRVRLRRRSSATRRRCARCCRRWSRSRRRTRRCSCAARPAPARSWSRTPSTSTRRASSKPFVRVNCAALAPGVLE